MIEAVECGIYAIVEFLDKTKQYVLEKTIVNGVWETWTSVGFKVLETTDTIVPVSKVFLDETSTAQGLYQYRAKENGVTPEVYAYSDWVRMGVLEPFGRTFGNYVVPEGSWGVILTPDDIRYTMMWGVDFKASNGQSFTDAQIEYFIEAAMQETERELNITLPKTIIKCEPEERNIPKEDYDDEESYTIFDQTKIERLGFLPLKKRPVISLQTFDILTFQGDKIRSLLESTKLFKKKGLLTNWKRGWKLTNTQNSVYNALMPYGSAQRRGGMYYLVDYIAGYETSDDVPLDLIQHIGKVATVSMLNIIGDGLIAGFSSSSLSLDGMSESFSSTQSATSAYFGARIMQYKKDMEEYIKKAKGKFGFVVMGNI